VISSMWLPESQDDWQTTFSAEKLDFIPDPMVMRVADLFVGGKSFAQDSQLEPSKVWDAIEHNLDGLLAFFHLLMTRDRIPLIDYEYTFMTTNFEELGDLAVVWHPPIYQAVKEQAELKLANVKLNRIPVARRRKLAANRAEEIEAVGYNWFPDPGALFTEKSDRVLARQLLGCLIFGGYAQVSGSDHVLQTTRASLLLELTQPDDAPLWGARQEAKLFGRLNEAVAKDPRLSVENSKVPPTILPFLINQKKPKNCKDLLQKALALREDDKDFVAYRGWHRDLREAWANGSHNEHREKDVNDVIEELAKRYPPGEKLVQPPMWSREIGLKAKIGAKAVFKAGVEPDIGDDEKLKASAEVGVEAGLEADAGRVVVSFPDRVRNFLIEGMWFRNHRKILLRLALQQRNSDYLLLGLKRLWMAS
jgi:hypothetical protein